MNENLFVCLRGHDSLSEWTNAFHMSSIQLLFCGNWSSNDTSLWCHFVCSLKKEDCSVMMNNFNTKKRHLARMNENFSTSIFHWKITTGKRINKQCYSIEIDIFGASILWQTQMIGWREKREREFWTTTLCQIANAVPAKTHVTKCKWCFFYIFNSKHECKVN